MIIGLITRRGVVFWNRLAELYRTIAVSASLDHLLPIVSVKNGVRKLAVGVQIDIENEIFQKKIQEKNRKEVKNEKNSPQLSSIPPPSTTEIARLDDWR